MLVVGSASVAFGNIGDSGGPSKFQCLRQTHEIVVPFVERKHDGKQLLLYIL